MLIVLAVVMAAVWIGLFSLGMRFDRESSRRHLPASPEPGPDPDRTAAPAAVARP
ncbi:MAG: hypothetical protein U0R70_11660 [Solirubrobacteraceae bacterium]